MRGDSSSLDLFDEEFSDFLQEIYLEVKEKKLISWELSKECLTSFKKSRILHSLSLSLSLSLSRHKYKHGLWSHEKIVRRQKDLNKAVDILDSPYL